ncbi:hypothetical protein BKA82DRAFT_738033 [Pisolithus tinctorius]|uniref:Uncharacterized protein n=1 Tax=Pisolithus tinctorius Marx 270 TaxID=870435 RepID=A0A0C3IVY9_PISTI|nr:hypothetical protein BKA82DRAFT_738033 [Pisolithus tinctorius]KIO00998.1 hypothetical protein M404DRAFT_738033 [Pisolithus tinctorius Marx 270]
MYDPLFRPSCSCPAVSSKPASLTSTITALRPSPAVPLKPLGLTNIRTMGTGPTPSRNFGTRNDIGRQRVIHEVAERLRVDHDCQQTNRKFRQRRGRSEHCHRALPLYFFVSVLFVRVGNTADYCVFSFLNDGRFRCLLLSPLTCLPRSTLGARGALGVRCWCVISFAGTSCKRSYNR